MGRYYFDIWSGDRVTQDDEGVECANDQAACDAAAKALLDLARDVIGETTGCELSIEVSDETKKAVCRITLQLEIERLGQGAAQH
jgi:Domain of unknown function (DUF6894)